MKNKQKTYYEISTKDALNWSIKKTFNNISNLIGKIEFQKACDISQNYTSPVANKTNSNWIKQSKIIGINPRIVGSYFNIVKYAITFPEDAIHIMPIWEVGCNGSLYSRTNWKLSEEWIDKDLIKLGYDTAEKQLKLTINLLHALGKKVGFDAVPHTDKFAEEVFVEPELFEWIRLNETKTNTLQYNDNNDIYPELKSTILDFLKENKSANKKTFTEYESFYSKKYTHEKRTKILFGKDLEQRTSRRIQLMNYVRDKGFETIPVGEHIPNRPILFKEIISNNGEEYADFYIPHQSTYAKLFNSITPYRWYKIDNNGYPIITEPIQLTFEYFIKTVSNIQKTYNFDFLRADMAHNQISHSHSSSEKDCNFSNEMWKLLKENIQKKTPYFATFAESFLSTYYIDGCSDMVNKNFDIVLGNINFTYLNQEFISCAKKYVELSENYPFSPCIATITNDSDQKSNDDLYQSPYANEIRYFTSLFLGLPSYAGIGFETRNLIPQKNNEYSYNYNNSQKEAYKFGTNKKLFKNINKMRKLYNKIKSTNFKQIFLDTEGHILAWVLKDNSTKQQKYLCVINLDFTKDKTNIQLKDNPIVENNYLKPIFSLKKYPIFLKKIQLTKPIITDFEFCDARIYEIK